MPTPFDLNAIGVTLQQAAGVLNDRVHNQISVLNFDQIQQMTNASQDLLIKSKVLFAQATIQLAADAQGAITNLQNAAKQINQCLATIADVQKAVDLAGDLVGVAASIMSGNVGSVISFCGSAISTLS